MLEINSLVNQIADLKVRTEALRGYLDYANNLEKLDEVNLELADPKVWQDQERAQQLGKEKSRLENIVQTIQTIEKNLQESQEFIDLLKEGHDDDVLAHLLEEVEKIQKSVGDLEFKRMFSGEMDANNAFLDVQSGSGGTEAQDWAEMILRMYLRWGEKHGFHCEVIEASAGEVAGIKSATVKFTGDYAFGWLRTETGVHRLVRKSPFDSNHKRHTSFASVFVSPEVDDKVNIEINPADLKVDTYRASGAGGQHVNRTDSAIRITHIPSGIVVQCQSDRSQHKNRSSAMSQLKSKLYEMEMLKRNEKQQKVEDSKSDIGWGHQIRSYVLDQSRIKDLRTGVEVGNTQAVLDGDLDVFIEASLKSGN
ncbi:MAG TPA: peptide chain release factor 2 [Gammaproteobacteria bacterium]|nr:peptide chain release factor 2 [Gammaproteobacteria bacterium]